MKKQILVRGCTATASVHCGSPTFQAEYLENTTHSLRLDMVESVYVNARFVKMSGPAS